MPYAIDWSNPTFPTIVEASEGDSWETLRIQVAAHHLEAAMDHIHAAERLIARAPRTESRD